MAQLNGSNTVLQLNGSNTVLQKLGQGALAWLEQNGFDPADPTVPIVGSDPGDIIPPDQGRTFADYKAGGLSDDDAMAAAVARGGTLVIDAGLTIHLTRTFNIDSPMQIISAASSMVGGGVIYSASATGLFTITPGSGPVLLQGLNIVDTAASGSIIVMNDDHSAVRDCQFANVAGNASTMVKFQGADQLIENSIFSNYEPTAYCWDANWIGGYNGSDREPVNDRVVGGAAFGPGKGGLLVNQGSHFTEGFAVDDWTCVTQGVQIQAQDVYSLEIHGGAYVGATGSAIVLGGGNMAVKNVVIEGAYIEAGGTAIDAAPVPYTATVDDLTVSDNQIVGAIGIAVSSYSGHVTLLGNTINATTAGLSILSPDSQLTVIDNLIASGGISVADSSGHVDQSYFGNTLVGPLGISGAAASATIFTSNSGMATYVGGGGGGVLQPGGAAAPAAVLRAVQAASSAARLPDFTKNTIAPAAGAFAAPGVNDTFSYYKTVYSGQTVSDDQAFANAIAALAPTHGTLVIDDGLTITLTHTVDVTGSMAIVSAGSGIDTTSTITSSGTGDMFHVAASGPVLIQGLNFRSGASGSIVATGTGNTVLRSDEFTNVVGNTSPMVVLQGPDQLVQDSYFENDEASAFDWSAAYINPTTDADVSSTISGGWGYGIGKGGLIGGDDAGPVIRGFDLNDWTIVQTGASQVEADNVAALDVQAGVFDYSSGAAILLGGGMSRIGIVTINGAFVSAAGAVYPDPVPPSTIHEYNPTKGIGIDAGLVTGGGVANLVVTNNEMNSLGTGVLAGGLTGNVTISGNSVRAGMVGLDIEAPTGAVTVVGNQVTPDIGSVALQTSAAAGSVQTFVGNTFDSSIAVVPSSGASMTFIDNLGSAMFVDAFGVPLQANGVASGTTAAEISAMPAAVISALTLPQVAALTAAQLGALTGVQFAAFSPAQVGALTGTQLGELTPAQAGGLTGAQLGAISALQMVGFTPRQMAAMSLGQLTTLVDEKFGADYLFDATYYLAHNPDVTASGADPYQQYMTVGWKEGRDPSALFDTRYYLNENPAVAAAGVNPLAEFEISGWAGGTDPSAGFSDSKYLAANPDVLAAKDDPLLHYVTAGQFEGRVSYPASAPDPLVDPAYVYAHNPTVAAAGLNPSDWYDSAGWQAGANPNAWFDTNFYLTQNPDVKTAGMDPLLHFEEYGEREGRAPSLVFDDAQYLSAFPDVKAANLDPLQHYLVYGQYEGRSAFLPGGSSPADPLVDAGYLDAQLGATLVPPAKAAAEQAAAMYDQGGWQAGLNPDAWFDTNYYLSHNPDVAAAHVDPLLHYELYGWKEGRDPSAAFSTDKYLGAYADVAAAKTDPLLHFILYGQFEPRTAFTVS